MRGTSEGTLSTILHVHVVVIITVSVALELPATAILELLGDLEPVPVISHPVDGGRAVGCVHLEDVEAGSETESAHSECLPEADPLDDAAVLVDDLTLFEVERGIGAHRGGLHEGLELVTWMGWSSLNTENALDWLLTKDWVAETASNVRELLIVSPLNLELVTLVVIVMASSRSVLKSLLMVDLLRLREPCSGGLSPPMVELKVQVVQVVMSRLTVGNLVKLGWDVALLIKVLGAHLGDMHVDHVRVVAVDLHHLVLIVAIDIDVVVGANVLVGQDNVWLSVLVTGCVHVPQLQVASLLLLIDLEEEVLLGHNFVVSILSELFTVDLVLELNEADLLSDDLVDSLSDINKMLRAARFAQLLVGAWHSGVLLQSVQVGSLSCLLGLALGQSSVRILPESLDAGSSGLVARGSRGNLRREAAGGRARLGVLQGKKLLHESCVLSTNHGSM